LRQTHQSDSIGWVLGGAPVSYREIEEETGFNRRTLEGWFRKLRRGGYIETSAAPSGVVVRITKAKKFAQTPHKFAEGVRGPAGSATRDCVAIGAKSSEIQQVPGGIGSSSVVGIKERTKAREIHRDFHKEIHRQRQIHRQNPSGLEETEILGTDSCSDAEAGEFESRQPHQRQNLNYDLRKLRRLLRWEREEAVRRELAVGTGPEVRRS
jgi:DNA-binding transcriptional regulator YhcF (GntR family)